MSNGSIPIYPENGPEAYRENILEIVDAWNGYPLQPFCPGSSTPPSAINAGSINIKCFINNICPFNASPLERDTLVFNYRTLLRIAPSLPDSLKKNGGIKYEDGLEGVFLSPKYVFRHNYIYKKKYNSNTEEDSNGNISISSEVIFPNNPSWYDNYEEISFVGNSIPGREHTRYKDEQSWIVVPSVFDKPHERELSSGEVVEECEYADWHYQSQTESRSQETENDIMNDYQSSYYAQQKAYNQQVYNNEIGSGDNNLDPKILNKIVQLPVQTNVYSNSSNRSPVHWRVIKKTPIFKGEDFFIKFYKKSNDSTIDQNSGTNKISFGNSGIPDAYRTLDVLNDQYAEISVGDGQSVSKRINEAIVPNTESDNQNSLDRNTFYLFNQAYYVVEMGYGSAENNYYIIISQSAPPMFVVVEKMEGSDKYTSRRLSVCDFISSGSSLIDQDYFIMTVRNHLGKLAITFDGPGFSSPSPWIIKKTLIEPKWDAVAEEVVFENKWTTMTTPRGLLSIWGGNLRAGFCFGPLQYSSSVAEFAYPPKVLSTSRSDSAFIPAAPLEIGTNTKGAFQFFPFFLPSKGKHHISFNSSDIYLRDLFRQFEPPQGSFSQPDKHLFVQDAQFYRNYDDPDKEGDTSNKGWNYGAFMYGETLREMSDVDADYCWKSTITVRKYRYLDDIQTRHQAFDVLVGLQAGDHIFTSGTWGEMHNYIKTSYSEPPSNPLTGFSQEVLPDDQWFLMSCKTPIMTHITLISDESKETRWADGTTIFQGMAKTPFNAQSPYFIDATDHVLSYSDSWSANNWQEVEHTGQISFYLNREMSQGNNVTDALLSLQNKNFYIEVWGGYRDCNSQNTYGYFKMFTGICQGGDLSVEYNQQIMTCRLVDYTEVLKAVKFFNSSFYDGVKDVNAIWDILKQCGFRSTGKYDPGSLIRGLSERASNGYSGVFFNHFDGRGFKHETYALPSGYKQLEQPSFKFSDGENYYNGIIKIAKKSGKTFYFDQFGIAHFEDLQDIIEADYNGKVPMAPLLYFSSNPQLYGGQRIYNKKERKYDVDKIANHIKIISTTPDMHPIIKDNLDWSSIDNPQAEGFLGYLKTFFQRDGIFGSVEAVTNAANKYKVMWRPRVHVKFEAYGVPLRANDIVSVDGETLRVIKVDHNLIASKNTWLMQVDCMRYQPIIQQ